MVKVEFKEITGTDLLIGSNGIIVTENFEKVPTKDINGYLAVDINGKESFIHRLVAYYFKRDAWTHLVEQSVIIEVHHRDKNKHNNDISNLVPMSREAHQRLHLEERKRLRDKKFIKIYHYEVEELGLSGNKLMLYALIENYSSSTNKGLIKDLEEIKKRIGVSISTINRDLKYLKDNEYIIEIEDESTGVIKLKINE